MSPETGRLSRRRLLASALLGTVGGLAGCSESDTAGENGTDSGPVPEPDEPPAALRDGVDVDALRDRTARAIAEEAFSVTGVVSVLRDGDIDNSRAKTGRGAPNEAVALHSDGQSAETQLETPQEAGSVFERYFDNGTMIFQRTDRSDEVDYGQQEADYADFARLVERDLDSFYEVGTLLQFGDPEWDETDAAYVIEATGFSDDETAAEASIESCRISVDAAGVVVGIDATLAVGSGENPERLRASVDGEAGINGSPEEPDWVAELASNLPVWTHTTGERPSSSVGGDRVYVASSSGVTALDRTDGTETWRFRGEGRRFSHAVADGTVYVGGGTDGVYAFNAESGEERWQQGVDDPLGAPLVVGGVVAFANLEGYRAFDADDGSPMWTFQPGEGPNGRVVADGLLCLGGSSGTVYGVDAASGEERWRFPTPARNWVAPQQAVDGRLYAGGFEGGVYCLNLADGGLQWSASTADAVTSVAAADGTVYAGNSAGEVYGLETTDGEERWRFEAGDTTHVHPDGEGTYVASYDGALYRLSADGDEEWAFEANGRMEAPAVGDDAVYIGSRDGTLYGVDRANGTEAWSRDLNFWARRAPVLREELLYATDLGSGRGTVYAFERPSL